jgi:hypothetical protein
MARPKAPSARSFIRRQLTADGTRTDEKIRESWKALTNKELDPKVISRERTLYQKVNSYDHQEGLAEFYTSQANLLLTQYQNIEQLLGPADSDWTWSGEHCEILLRDAIRKVLPKSLRVGKGYIYGLRDTDSGPERSPEIDILIYDSEQFAPIFSMGMFAIVRAESVRGIIQVKRTLDPGTLTKAVANVVAAKQHVLATSQFNAGSTTERTFSAVVGFEDSLQSSGQASLSKTYGSALQPHISKLTDGVILPDFVGTLSGLFLHFPGLNTEKMLYQAFSSLQNGKNAALPYLLYMLAKKIRPYGLHILPAFPEKMDVKGSVVLWQSK